MADEEEEVTLKDEVEATLTRIQEFEPESLVREKDLGASLKFSNAVEPAKQLINLYRRLSLTALQDFPEDQLEKIKKQANSTYGIFTQILEFDPTQDNANQVRENLVEKLGNAYKPAFDALHPLISFSLHRAADFQQLDQDARAALQEIRDEANGVMGELENARERADDILEEARKVAAEAGVAQQATHFRDAAEKHETQKKEWRSLTVRWAMGLGGFAIASFFIHKIPWLTPSTTYEAVQLAISKVLVFATISYMLYLAAKNFLAHKHNEIVNRHRQDALMTYRALVDAAEAPANRDVVLTYAAACIFGPQGTGYAGDGERNDPPKNVIELLTRQVTEE